jgi:hypothetical protein
LLADWPMASHCGRRRMASADETEGGMPEETLTSWREVEEYDSPPMLVWFVRCFLKHPKNIFISSSRPTYGIEEDGNDDNQ